MTARARKKNFAALKTGSSKLTLYKLYSKKKIWDVVNRSCAEPIITSQIRKKEKDNAITSKIIK